MTEIDEKWNMQWNTQYEKLVEFQQRNDDCLVPTQKTSLGQWVLRQRNCPKNNKLRQDRKELFN
jgi:hypothetical protein